MAVLACPHCGSVAILTGGDTDDDVCPRRDCRGIMARLAEPDAGAAIRKAFYGHDHELDSAITPNPHGHLLAMGGKPR